MVTMVVFVAAISSLSVIVAGAFFWIMTEIRAIRKDVQEEFRAERQARQAEREADRQERRADTQRILEAIYFHRHDPNTGEAMLYPPAPSASAD